MPSPSSRIIYLDALRGLAVLGVMLARPVALFAVTAAGAMALTLGLERMPFLARVLLGQRGPRGDFGAA